MAYVKVAVQTMKDPYIHLATPFKSTDNKARHSTGFFAGHF